MTKRKPRRSRKRMVTVNPRHPKRKSLRANRVEVELETEIGDIDVTFNFPTDYTASLFFWRCLDSYSVRGASLVQHGKFKGARDGRGS